MKTRTSFPDLHKTALALAVVVALCGVAALNASAATSGVNPFTTVAHATVLRQGDAVVGALPMTQPIRVVVALKLRNKAVLDAFIANSAKNQSGGKAAQLMSSDQILANHMPTQQQAQAVAGYLTSMGFSNVTVAPNRLLVTADGTALTARNAFMTSFAQVKTRDGRIAYANTEDVRVPAALSDKVLSVIGLQSVHQARPPIQQSTGAGSHTDAVLSHDPTEFPAIYGGTGVAPASDITIGIVSAGTTGNGGSLNTVIADLNSFTATHGLPLVTTGVVLTNGPNTEPDDESQIPSQTILGMAGGQVRKIAFYNLATSQDSDLTAGFNAIVSANVAKVIENLYSNCETDAQADGSAAADDAIFEVAVAQGQTFVMGAGSFGGANQCNNFTNTPLWPASSQYVVAVANTLLNASANTWFTEQVYNQTGGSPSTFEPMPAWQTAFGVTGSTRVDADVAFDGFPDSGVRIIVDGNGEVESGTDVSASLFAGVWASVLQARGSGFGFAGPVIYALPATDFHDITVGNNNGGRPALGYAAGTGYDFPSGRGSMIISKVVADSAGVGNKPPVANFTYTASGLTASFTDTSTDTDGSIASHSWDFGDGGTSIVANPSHTYAAAGIYSVTEHVLDNDGAGAVKTEQVPIGAVQLIVNPGFETGAFAPWVITNPDNTPLYVAGADQVPHSGNFEVLWGPRTPSSLSQQVTIPAYETSATLSLWLKVGLGTTRPPVATDRVKLLVTTPDGTTLAKLDTFTNRFGPNYTWEPHAYDMTPFIGQTVKIRFEGTSDPDNTSFSLDDITLNVH